MLNRAWDSAARRTEPELREISTEPHHLQHLFTRLKREGRVATCPEYPGRRLQEPYELSPAISRIDHRNTKIHAPYTNRPRERFHLPVSGEFFNLVSQK